MVGIEATQCQDGNLALSRLGRTFDVWLGNASGNPERTDARLALADRVEQVLGVWRKTGRDG